MVTLNGAYLKNQFHDSRITTEESEYVLDGAVNLLNSFDAGLSELTGAAGSKTGTYTSKQTGAIMAVALQIYRENYKHADSVNAQVSGLGVAFSTTNQLLSFARQLADAMKPRYIRRT